MINHNIIQITIRLHPSEKPTNFNWAISLQYPQVVKSNAKNLIEDFIQHDVVVGSDSMAMALAIMCKKRVVCSIPPKGRVCSLPFDEIEMLRDLTK